jgi:hypothetical protein
MSWSFTRKAAAPIQILILKSVRRRFSFEERRALVAFLRTLGGRIYERLR